MRPGWNPTRRNRHAGTQAHGHGQDNRMTIPESWRDRRFYYEKLSAHTVVTRTIGAHELRFFVEPTRPDWFYPCTVDDICNVLSHCDPEAVSLFDFVVMRQPTRKQKMLCPVWGRALFYSDIDTSRGAAIFIEAHDLSPVAWGKSLDPEDARELDRLRGDGHDVRTTRRGFEVHVTPASLRNTALYRTLLHEIGHHVDHARCSEAEWDGRTRAVKEDYAHRYAQELYEVLAQQGVLPFAPIIDDPSLERGGLKREWFCLP